MTDGKNIIEGIERPNCFGSFSSKSEFCNKVCKHANACIDYKQKKDVENEIPSPDGLQDIE